MQKFLFYEVIFVIFIVLFSCKKDGEQVKETGSSAVSDPCRELQLAQAGLPLAKPEDLEKIKDLNASHKAFHHPRDANGIISIDFEPLTGVLYQYHWQYSLCSTKNLCLDSQDKLFDWKSKEQADLYSTGIPHAFILPHPDQLPHYRLAYRVCGAPNHCSKWFEKNLKENLTQSSQDQWLFWERSKGDDKVLLELLEPFLEPSDQKNSLFVNALQHPYWTLAHAESNSDPCTPSLGLTRESLQNQLKRSWNKRRRFMSKSARLQVAGALDVYNPDLVPEYNDWIQRNKALLPGEEFEVDLKTKKIIGIRKTDGSIESLQINSRLKVVSPEPVVLNQADAKSRFLKDHSFKNLQSKLDQSLYKFPEPVDAAKARRKVLVAGGGPVGLMSAIKAFQNGEDVVLVEKRSRYSRDVILAIDDEHLKTLEEIIGKGNFIKLKQEGVIRPTGKGFFIQVKDLEQIMAGWLQSASKKNPDRLKMLYGYELDASEESFLARSKKGDVVVLDDIDLVVGADSKNSKVAEWAGIGIETVSSKSYAALATFEIPSPDFQINTKFGSAYHASIVLQTGNKIYISYEISEEAFNEYSMLDSEADKRAWIMKNLNGFLSSENQEKLKAIQSTGTRSAFPIELTKASRVTGQIEFRGKPTKVFLAGDSVATTHFHTGTGANRGLHDAYKFAEYLKNNEEGVYSVKVAESVDAMHQKVYNHSKKWFKTSKIEANTASIKKTRHRVRKPFDYKGSRVSGGKVVKLRWRLVSGLSAEESDALEIYKEILEDKNCWLAQIWSEVDLACGE